MIKKILAVIVLLVVGVLAVGWYNKRKEGLNLYQPEFATIVRDDLDITVNASGEVKPASRTEIKSKASGTVEEVTVEPGSWVKKGDLLIKLDPKDEQRNVDARKLAYQKALQNYELARIQLKDVRDRYPLLVRSSLARLEGTAAQLNQALVDFRRAEQMRSSLVASDDPREPEPVEPESVSQEVSFSVVVADDKQFAPLFDRARKALIHARELIAEAEAAAEFGHQVVNNYERDTETWTPMAMTWSEYELSYTKVWSYAAQLLERTVDLQDAITSYKDVEQGEKQVEISRLATEEAKTALDDAMERLIETDILSPVDGIVEDVFAREGMVISGGTTTFTGGTPLMMLAETDQLYVDADVDEAEIGQVRELAPLMRSANLRAIGDEGKTLDQALAEQAQEGVKLLEGGGRVTIKVDAFRDETFYGEIARVEPKPRVANNVVTYGVRIRLTSPNSQMLMLGMKANVEFDARQLKNVLLVRFEAIRNVNEQQGVYVQSDGKPRFVPVTLGVTDGEFIHLKVDDSNRDVLKADTKVYTKLPRKDDEDQD